MKRYPFIHRILLVVVLVSSLVVSGACNEDMPVSDLTNTDDGVSLSSSPADGLLAVKNDPKKDGDGVIKDDKKSKKSKKDDEVVIEDIDEEPVDLSDIPF